MAVTVVNSRFTGTSGHITGKDVYESGTSFAVDGLGHLIVADESGSFDQTVAAYKPGSWISAYLGDAPEIK